MNGTIVRAWVEPMLVPELRPGDIVGALTGEAGLHKDAVGKIDVFATRSYVAIARGQVGRALGHLQGGKIKGRRFRVARM